MSIPIVSRVKIVVSLIFALFVRTGVWIRVMVYGRFGLGANLTVLAHG